jgi:hypothetical protein
MRNPQGSAWVNMWSTREGQQKGPYWARQAVWGNIPDSQKKLYGNVDNVTSGSFMDLWKNKIETDKWRGPPGTTGADASGGGSTSDTVPSVTMPAPSVGQYS